MKKKVGTPIFCYDFDFDVEDILLGEGSDVSMVELRPCLVTEFSGLDSFALLSSRNIPQSASLASQGISNEERMRVFGFEVLLVTIQYQLIFVGTQIASLSGGEKAGFAFLAGGIGGFLYLLLL